MELLDTQIISYKYKGAKDYYDDDIKGKYISSVTALEFLQTIDKGSLTSARYYPPIPPKSLSSAFHYAQLKNRGHGKQGTDSLIVDLGGKYDSFTLFSNYAVSESINSGNKAGIMDATWCLEKNERKKISRRIDFLMDEGIQVIPLNPLIVEYMLNLLGSIDGQYNMKKDYQNSMRDLLIASTAVQHKLRLITQDNELNRVIAQCEEYRCRKINDHIVEIDMRGTECDDKVIPPKDSKGYINRGWDYSFRRGTF